MAFRRQLAAQRSFQRLPHTLKRSYSTVEHCVSAIHDEVLAANGRYAESFGDKGKLTLPPARGFAILTCMDARLDPAK